MKPMVGTPSDYAKSENWLARPDAPNKGVDVFYLYPSSCFDPKAPTISPIDNKIMRHTAKNIIAQQASAFEHSANIFAPFWRQVSAVKLSSMSFEEVDAAEWAEPRSDVYAALDYYFEHLNGGRPFFLAGHSQGSRLTYMALSEYFAEHPDYYANMICAYCLGDSLTESYLEANPHVRAATCADDTGVVVSWNTEGPDNIGHDSLVVAPGAISINPLNWRRDETPASADLNLGSFMGSLLVPKMHRLPVKADATINLARGTVIVSEPRLKKCAITELPGMEGLGPVFGPASYHMCDYSFFYLNLRENIQLRADAFLAQKR